MQDEELFELCKDVYEATGWGLVLGMSHVSDGVILMREYRSGIAFRPDNGDFPLYTSDYLFCVLPPVVQDPYDKIFRHIQMWINGDGTAHAGYVEPYAHDDKVAYAQDSIKMQITLLKLTLKLYEQGLLK